MESIPSLIEAFNQHYEIASNYSYMQSVASFDSQTVAPKNKTLLIRAPKHLASLR
jgi:hypothetical protein